MYDHYKFYKKDCIMYDTKNVSSLASSGIFHSGACENQFSFSFSVPLFLSPSPFAGVVQILLLFPSLCFVFLTIKCMEMPVHHSRLMPSTRQREHLLCILARACIALASLTSQCCPTPTLPCWPPLLDLLASWFTPIRIDRLKKSQQPSSLILCLPDENACRKHKEEVLLPKHALVGHWCLNCLPIPGSMGSSDFNQKHFSGAEGQGGRKGFMNCKGDCCFSLSVCA